MEIQLLIRGDLEIGLINMSEELTLATIDKFRTHVATLMAPHRNIRHYIIDLIHVEFIDSAGLGSLVSILRRVRDLNGDVKLTRLQPGPRKAFEIIRADKVFDIYDSPEAALNSFKEQ